VNQNELFEKIIAGNIVGLGKGITLVEANTELKRKQAAQLIDMLLPYTGSAIKIGITGVPGVGKSTFIESFGLYLISLGYKVAVLAIDPSSSINHGSILGDKTRMELLSVHPNAFIRPSASGGSLGGVTYKTLEASILCDAAGYNIILIETVGVGQSETEVSEISDYMLLLMLAGAGDELQGIKRGIMELADGIAITKADGQNLQSATVARAEFARAIHFFPSNASGCIPSVHICSSLLNSGLDELWESIESYINTTKLNGFFENKRNSQKLKHFKKLFIAYIQQQYTNNPIYAAQIQDLEDQVIKGEISPYSAILKLFSNE
jgi:LAO/AO transport system kinase